MGVCLTKEAHSCGSRNGLQLFEKEDGTIDGFCFACSTYVPDPLKDRPAYKPAKLKKSPEEIQKELEEINSYKSLALKERGIRKEILEEYGVKVGVSEVDGETPVTHYYPYFKEGEHKAYKVRLIEDKRIWSIGDQSDVDMFGWDTALAAGSKKLFITEGELDALSLYQIMVDQVKGTQYEKYAPAVVSLPHGAASAARDIVRSIKKIKEHYKEIVLVFDMDDAGKKATEEVVRLIPEALVANLPAKDVNECLMQGRAKACYNACVFNAQKPKNTRIVRVSDVADKARQPVEWGYSWPYKKLTELTRGIRLGETYYLGAG